MVEIKSFAVVESIYKPRLRIPTSTVELAPLRAECSKEPTPPAADSIAGRSPALFVHVFTTSPPTPALHTQAWLTTAFQPMAPLPTTPSSTNSADTSLLDRIPRITSLFPAGIATSLHGMHLPCHIGLVLLPLIRSRHSSPNF